MLTTPAASTVLAALGLALRVDVERLDHPLAGLEPVSMEIVNSADEPAPG